MPTIKPISELQRNTAALVREAMETKEPIYLTKNGSASVVLLDAREYDRQIKAYKELHREYVRTSVLLGRMQADSGMFHAWDEVKQQLFDRWGEDVLDV